MFDRNDPSYYERRYVVTNENREQVDEFVLDRRDFPNDNCEDEAIRLVYSLAEASKSTLLIHSSSRYASPIYKIRPDGTGYRYATGRKAGPFTLKEEA